MIKYPRYELATKKIIGAKKGSLIWLHEYRHLLQHKSDLLSYYFILSYWFSAIAILLAVFDPIKSLYGILGIVILMFYLEIDAWIYAFSHVGKANISKET